MEPPQIKGREQHHKRPETIEFLLLWIGIMMEEEISYDSNTYDPENSQDEGVPFVIKTIVQFTGLGFIIFQWVTPETLFCLLSEVRHQNLIKSLTFQFF
jgi:hypothetical protein